MYEKQDTFLRQYVLFYVCCSWGTHDGVLSPLRQPLCGMYNNEVNVLRKCTLLLDTYGTT